jgi:hypothetical protein
MKKILILGLVALTTLTANAQRKRTKANTSQGMWALRIGAGFNSETEDPAGDPVTKIRNLTANPSVGYFVADNLELGVNFGIGSKRTEQTITVSPLSTNTDSRSNTNVGLYVQKYWPMNNWFALYGKADAGLGFGNGENKFLAGSGVTTTTGVTENGFGGAINMGFAFTPVSNMALMADIAGFGIQSSTTDPDGANNSIAKTNLGVNVWRQPYQLTMVWFFGNGSSDY